MLNIWWISNDCFTLLKLPTDSQRKQLDARSNRKRRRPSSIVGPRKPFFGSGASTSDLCALGRWLSKDVPAKNKKIAGIIGKTSFSFYPQYDQEHSSTLPQISLVRSKTKSWFTGNLHQSTPGWEGEEATERWRWKRCLFETNMTDKQTGQKVQNRWWVPSGHCPVPCIFRWPDTWQPWVEGD